MKKYNLLGEFSLERFSQMYSANNITPEMRIFITRNDNEKKYCGFAFNGNVPFVYQNLCDNMGFNKDNSIFRIYAPIGLPKSNTENEKGE